MSYLLYVILDKNYCQTRSPEVWAELFARAGADLIQYRNKTGSDEEKLNDGLKISAILKKSPSKLIINDDPVLAKEVQADGVHLGQEDGSIREARRLLGKKSTIGISTHSLKEAKRAFEEGADYLAVGDLFGSQTKTDSLATPLTVLNEICRALPIPVIGIGGITHKNKLQVLNRGAKGIAVSGSVMLSENPYESCRQFKE